MAQLDSVSNSLKPDSTQITKLQDQGDSDRIHKHNSHTVSGIIVDFTTSEPISFATIAFYKTSKGSRADLDGKFSITSNPFLSDTLVISSIGYTKKFIDVRLLSKLNNIKIELERTNIQTRDVVIRYDRDPGLTLIKKVIKNKPLNNYDKASNYSYEVYNKLEMDINKIPPKAFKQSPILKKFDFVQDFIDSTSEEKPFLPLFLTETISDYYYQSKPKKFKEIIKGSRISGYKNQSVSQLLGSMYQNINIYNNNIPVFEVNFISPISNDAPFYYKYKIIDTQIILGKEYYRLIFTPKRVGERTFNGELWIHDTDYAVKRINMVVTKEQNINWVNKITLYQEFSCFEDTLWFLTKDKFYVDFLPPHGNKVAGFLGRKTTTYKNIKVNSSKIEEFIESRRNTSDSYIETDAINRNEDYWNQVRHDSLSANEKAIYKLIDTIQRLPFYKKYYNLFYFLSTGIVEAGPIEIGSLYNLYSRNIIEGPRFRVNIGTTPKLFKNVYLRGYLAYGTQDERFKYSASALWLLKRQPRMYLYAEHKSDIDNTVNSYDKAGSIDNIFNNIGRKSNVPWKLAFVDRTRLEFYNSYFNGFSYQLSAEHKQYTPYHPLPYIGIFVDDAGKNRTTITNNEVGIELRFAYKEQFIEGNYYRTSLGSKYPAVNLYLGAGFKHVLGGEYNFQRVRFSISDNIKGPHIGNFYYNLFAGKVFGTLPYPLLEIHPGNEFFYYNSRTFNMMYRYEYLSDTYAGLMTEHNMGSLFFKYIPYVNKMRLRTFWNAKGVYGKLTRDNEQLNFNKGYQFETLRGSPYLELGTGVENIFKVLRVDFVWRVLPSTKFNDSPARRFGIFGSMRFQF